MRTMRRTGHWMQCLLLATVAASPALGASRTAENSRPLQLGPATAPASQPSDDHVKSLTMQLGDLRPKVRADAERQLIAIGPSVRPAMIEAARSDAPEIAARATSILQSLPWDLPTDPPAVRAILQRRFQRSIPQERQAAVVELLRLPNNAGLDAAMRILRDESDPAVRWTVVRDLRISPQRSPHDPADLTQATRAKIILHSLDSNSIDPPVLCLLGDTLLAQNPTDPSPAVDLFLRALLANDRAEDDGGELSLVQEQTNNLLWSLKRYDDLGRLLRHLADRGSDETVAGVSSPVADLFALHARVGPVRGYAEDLNRFSADLLHPPLLYAQSHVAQRSGHRVVAYVLDRLALLAGGENDEWHFQTAHFCQQNSWTGAAERELRAYLAVVPPADDNAVDHATDIANAHLMLGLLRVDAADHAGACVELGKGLDLLSHLPVSITRNHNGIELSGTDAVQDLRTQLLVEQFRDAVSRHQAIDAAQYAKDLIATGPTDPEVVQDLVAYYGRTGDVATADKLFTPTQVMLADKLKDDPSAENMNSYAWFLARARRQLDEAKKDAEAVVAAEPSNPAYIDTLAEVYFQKGDAAAAVKLERGGLAGDPDRPELQAQLHRFEGGLRKPQP